MTDEIDFGDLEVSGPYREMLRELDAGPQEVAVLLQDAITEMYTQYDQQRRTESDR